MHNSIVLFINIGGSEGVVIIFAVLLLFGGKKLPELARGLGKGIREFKDASDDMKREIHRNINLIEEKPEVKESSKSGDQNK
jgi:sec-independent protein translocase protein TatA